MASADTYRLGIDFGSSHTTAILRRPDGHTRALLFDGSPLLPSAVYAEPNGRLVVGRDAIHASRLDPTRFEANPKSRIDDSSVRLGDTEVAVSALVAAVLARVRDEGVRVSGVPDKLGVTLTHPAGWGAARRDVLAEAAQLAGLPRPRLVAEPIAAASYFVEVLGRTIPPGSALVVYNLGGGTFDASAVVPSANGYEILAVDGLDGLGGANLDSALVEHLVRHHLEQNPELWQRLRSPQNAEDRLQRRHLWDDVRAAKEALSHATSATVPVPLLDLEARITRDEFESLARPLIERTVHTTAAVMRLARLTPERVVAILLVGGSSRIPLVADLVRSGTGVDPTATDQPETVIAEGGVRVDARDAGGAAAPAVPGARPGPAPPPQADAVPIGMMTSETLPGKNPPPASLRPPVDPWASRDDLTPVLPDDVPTVPAHHAQPPPPVSLHQVSPEGVSPPPYQDSARPKSYQGNVSYGRRRRWPTYALGLATVAAVATAAALVLPGIIGGAPGPGPSTPQSETPYRRINPPSWVPVGWDSFVDDERAAAVVAGPATNGGECTYSAAGVLAVRRDVRGVSGCVGTPEVKAVVVRAVAVEAELAIRSGCAGIWARTGTHGYFLSVCDDGTVSLHLLFRTDPDAETELGRWTPTFDRGRVVAGLLAEGPNLTVYIDGASLGTVSDTAIGSGRVGVGGFAPRENGLDLTFNRLRSWVPAGDANGSGAGG